MAEEFLKNKPETAREKIIVAAFELFHERGIHDTSVDDILKASGTGKSQFYHYFKSKDGLIQSVMEEAYHKVKNGEVVGYESIETWDQLKAWFEGSVDKMEHYQCKRSCPMGRFIAEISEEDEIIRQGSLMVFEAMKTYPKEFFIREQARGGLCADADPEGLAEFCISIIQGACLLTKAARDSAVMRRVCDHAYAYLESFKRT